MSFVYFSRPRVRLAPYSAALQELSCMDLATFRRSLTDVRPPPGMSKALIALWHDARGDWNRAHDVVMSADGRDAAWVHAYLHRKEKDLENARYWYRKARRQEFTGSFEEEWEAIAAQLLA
jgi:hypothetical protein